MSDRSAAALLELPVRTPDGVVLGRPRELLLDFAGRRAVGFSVHCGDGLDRFLPFAATDAADDGLVVRSALTLLESSELPFYRSRSTDLRDAIGKHVAFDGGKTGVLQDVAIAADGTIAALVVSTGDRSERVEPGEGVRLALRRRPSAA